MGHKHTRSGTSVPAHKIDSSSKTVRGGGVGARCAEGLPQSSGPLQGETVVVVVVLREEWRQDGNSLICFPLQSPFDFSNVLLCDPESGVALCTEWPMSGG